MTQIMTPKPLRPDPTRDSNPDPANDSNSDAGATETQPR